MDRRLATEKYAIEACRAQSSVRFLANRLQTYGLNNLSSYEIFRNKSNRSKMC